MTERSLSHKSDGRHSSAGHSVHSLHSVPSGRTSSLGLDTNFVVGGHGDDSPLEIHDPPPGLFVLGSVPSIIRCWLTTNFSHPALLYAVVCTGSQRSTLEYSLVKDLGLADDIHKDHTGRQVVRLPIYLPEAIITQPSSRSNSPAPHLPTLSADFEIVGFTQRINNDHKKSIRVYIGSDTLRAHNADILFSQNLMTLYSDDRNKLSVPFVRPEDESTFRNLCTTNIAPERNELKATAPPFTPTELKSKAETTPEVASTAIFNNTEQKATAEEQPKPPPEPQSPSVSISASEPTTRDRASSMRSTAGLNGNISDSEKHPDSTAEPQTSETTSSDSTRRESAPGIWGSWRQASSSINGSETESTSGYQRATRGGRSMKVLKPSKPISSTPSIPSRSTSSARTYEPPPTRPSGEIRRKSQVENVPLKWEPKRGSLEEPKTIASLGNKTMTTTTIPRSSNPVGGASAFAWMNVSKSKASATAE
jgi:hypothetical protein